jgi:hypothetical protein
MRMRNYREYAYLIKMGPHVSKQEHEQENPCYLQYKLKQMLFEYQHPNVVCNTVSVYLYFSLSLRGYMCFSSNQPTSEIEDVMLRHINSYIPLTCHVP